MAIKSYANAEAHTLYLDLDDEITSVIDRIAAVDSSDVTIVVPKGAVVIQSIVNLKLLRRSIERLKKNVVVVTRDETGQVLAQRAGFAVKTSVNGQLLAARPVKQSAPSPMIQEDRDAAPQTEIPEEHIESEAVTVRPSVAAEVEAHDSVVAPRRSIRSPQRQKVLPRVSRASGQHGIQKNNEGLALSARARRMIGASSRTTRTGQNKHGHKQIGLLPDLPWKRIGVGTAAAVVIAFVGFTFLFAHATVIVTPKTETAGTDFELTAKEQPDASKGEVLGKIVTLSREGKKTITATGSKETGEKATGSVTISNIFSDKPQSFGVNTRLQAGSGHVFLLTAQVTVPGAKVKSGKAVAGSTSASVVAEKFGDEYNIGPSGFTLIDLSAEQQAGITGSSDSAMSGGSKKQITVLTNEDLDKAKDAVKGELEPTLVSEIKSKLESDQELLDGATSGSASKVASNKQVGEEAGQVDVTVTIEVKAIVDRPEDIKAAAVDELKKSLPANQELLDADEPTVTWSKKGIDFEQKKLIIAVHAEKTAAYRVDTASLLGQLLGKKEKEAREYLEGLSEVSSARVRLSPFWRNNLPGNPGKVKIEVNQ